MARTDVVIEIVDARLPQASSNPMIQELRQFRQRPCLKVLNKSDLADPQVTKAWLAYYNAQPGIMAVALSCKKQGDPAKIPALCRKLAPHRNDLTKPLRMMIMGIPNVGKSTLMNALLKKRVAAVGDEPAVTKTQQTLDLGKGMTLTDTPGMMWPKIEHDSDGYMLAASHAIGVNAVMEEEVADFLGQILCQRYPERLVARYKIALPKAATDPAAGTPLSASLLEQIAERRGCRGRGGVLDLEKAALILLADYRNGALGPVSLETPASRAAMLAQAEAEKQQAEHVSPEGTPPDTGSTSTLHE